MLGNHPYFSSESASGSQDNIPKVIQFTLEDIGATDIKADNTVLIAQYIANLNIDISQNEIYYFELVDEFSLFTEEFSLEFQ